MILRLIRGVAIPIELAALQAALLARLGGTDRHPAGPTRYHLASRNAADQIDVLIMSLWPSAEAALEGDAQEASPLRVAMTSGIRDLSTAHFEVDSAVEQPGDGEPIAIRVATGVFSRHGADIEMLNLLRERLPLVGDDITEAYVGRRLVGRAVEVAFVSAWRRIPEDRPLEEPFWPDIALRYDRFTVEVFGHVGGAVRIG